MLFSIWNRLQLELQLLALRLSDLVAKWMIVFCRFTCWISLLISTECHRPSPNVLRPLSLLNSIFNSFSATFMTILIQPEVLKIRLDGRLFLSLYNLKCNFTFWQSDAHVFFSKAGVKDKTSLTIRFEGKFQPITVATFKKVQE